MPHWRKTIDIKAILHREPDNHSPEYAASVAHDIAALVRASTTEAEQDFRLLNVVEELESVDAEDPDAVEHLDSCLSDLYDWGDSERVWLGL